MADLSTLDLAALTAEAERLGATRVARLNGTMWEAVSGDAMAWTAGGGPWLLVDLDEVVWCADEAAAIRGLLDQPEARRIAAIVDAAEARGRAAAVRHNADIISRGGHRD